jgi:sugar phosphate isomerase/epimerase
MTDLPVVGAAMTIEEIEAHHDWLLEKPRDLEIQDFSRADVLEADWQPLVDRAKLLLDGHTGRLGIHGPFWGFTIDSSDPDVRAIVTKRFNQGLDACEALGANQMVIHSPYTTWGYNNMDNYEGAREQILERCHQTLDSVVKRAEDQGVTLVIENIEDVDPHDRVKLAASFNSDAVAVSIDTGHALYAYGSTGAPPVDYYVTAAGNRLHHIHLQDADGYADRHWSLGEGTMRWPAFFAALAKLTSNPRLIIEIKDKNRIEDSAAFLASLDLVQ